LGAFRTYRLVLALVAAAALVACRKAPPPAPVAPAPSGSSATAQLPPLPPLRPPVMGRTAGVSTGHPLATAAAMEILQNGGNAFDAGVAAMLVCGVTEQDLYSLGGEGTALIYPHAERRVISVNGVGWAP